MDKYIFYDTKQSNHRVTDKYVSLIRQTLELLGKKCLDKKKLKVSLIQKNTGIVAIDYLHVIKAKLLGYRSIIYWVQGVLPEESFMRNKSKIRKIILSILEKKALRSAKFLLFVSNSMLNHYREKYGFVAKNYYIMPCFSSDLDNTKDFNGVRKNVFLYSGGITVWQCFPETVALYKKIEKINDKIQFLILTSEKEEAKKILEKVGVQNYRIDYLEGDNYRNEIEKCKFGFCLRKNDIVNKVATPTKFSDYISTGIIPIYSKNTEDFYTIAKNNEYCICVEDNGFMKKLEHLLNSGVYEAKVMESFKSDFGNYYSTNSHIKKMSEIFENVGL